MNKKLPNLVYGKQVNKKWMRALRKRFPKGFTFAQASQHYHKTHPGDVTFIGMNCGNYLAGAVTNKWIVRIHRGVYRWTQKGRGV